MKEIFQNLYFELFKIENLGFQSLSKTNIESFFPVLSLLDNLKKRKLEKLLHYKIKYVGFFEQALLHRSHPYVHREDNVSSNERLEYLGDSILGMVVAEYLFSLNLRDVEGDLTRIRSFIVSKGSLAIVAKHLKLEEFIFVSYSAEKSILEGNKTILADAVEALIAAIYLDGDFKAAQKFIIKTMLPIIRDNNQLLNKNFKSQLLEAVQGKGIEPPTYNVLEETGPPHDRHFTVGVFIQGKLFGSGEGKTKKEAEQYAAAIALGLVDEIDNIQ